MNDISVSVLMPVYNGERFVGEAIESILCQSLESFELIVIDDGSTDRTSEILDLYSRRDARVRVVRQPNSGIVAALNTGLEVVRGRFVARMDADDVAMPDRLQIQAGFLEKNADYVAVGSSYALIGSITGLVRKPKTNRGCLACLILQSCFGHPTVMMRTETLRLNKICYETEFQYAEDYRLWTVLCSHGKLANLGMPLLSYRIHDSQVRAEKSELQRLRHASVSSAFILARTAKIIDSDEVAFLLWGRILGFHDLIRKTSIAWRVIVACRGFGFFYLGVMLIRLGRCFFRPL